MNIVGSHTIASIRSSFHFMASSGTTGDGTGGSGGGIGRPGVCRAAEARLLFSAIICTLQFSERDDPRVL